MKSALLTGAALLSTIFFPWPYTVILALICSITEPLVPFAVGIVADTLYYSSSGKIGIPLWTLLGALTTLTVLFVQSRLSPSMIRK